MSALSLDLHIGLSTFMASHKNEVTKDGLAEGSKALLQSGDLSDFTLECGSRQFKVHRAVICHQAGFLKSLCTSAFKEGVEGRASLQETDPTILEKALEFFYTGTYDDGAGSENQVPEEQGRSSPLLVHVRLYHLAGYLGALKLKQEASSRCQSLLKNQFDPEILFDGIQEALTPCNPIDLGLKMCVLRSCLEYKRRLLVCHELEELLMELEPLAWTLMKEEEEARSQVERASYGRVMTLQNDKSKMRALIHSQRDSISDLTRETSTQRATINSQGDRLASARRETDLARHLLDLHQKCGNCDGEFGAGLEIDAQGKVGSLRCKSCQHRHGSDF